MNVGKYFKGALYYGMGIVVAFCVALLLRIFVVDFYVVPGESMLPTIEPGDFICVDKVTFGARLSRNTIFFEGDTASVFLRMKGFAPIGREDVVVFNFPYCANDWSKLVMNKSRFYVKRCIGLPGDTLSIRDGFYEVNGVGGIGNIVGQDYISGFRGKFPEGIFRTIPFEPSWGWTILEMGPLYIPQRGVRVQLDSSAVVLYRKMIEYEVSKPLICRGNRLYCGDSLMTEYCFRTNWYFMSGDNHWNSQDSRYLGLIPEEFIIGKARLILTARDPITGKYRWKRFFTKVQ